MSIPLQLEQMSIQDKIHTMEYLWDDLCRRSEVSSPPWHNQILLECERDALAGNATFIDWDVAKERNQRFPEMKIRILDSASQDLVDGYHFYEKQESGLGDYFIWDFILESAQAKLLNLNARAVA